MKNLRQRYVIDAPTKLVWQALTDPAVIEEWGAGPAKMSVLPEDDYSLWGGDIFGKIVEINPRHKLVISWKEKRWGDQPFSTVTFQLKEEAGKTEVELVHEGVPDTELTAIDDGWHQYFFEPLKDLVEELAEEQVSSIDELGNQ